MPELKIPATAITDNDRLARAIRAYRLLIQKENSLIGQRDHLQWQHETFRPLMESILLQISELEEKATNSIRIKTDADMVEHTKQREILEKDSRYDTDIFRDNAEIRV